MKVLDLQQRMARAIEMWSVDRLVPYERNPRTHSPDQVRRIADSIEQFGFTSPLLVDSKDGIIAGHGRLLAARLLGLPEVPVIVLDYLTDAQRRAYVIADNKLAELAGWDDELLAQELAALSNEEFPLEVIGFSDEELAALLEDDVPNGAQEGEDEVPEVPTQAVSQAGDLWVCGEHRLVCGDSRDPAVLARLMDGRVADLYSTDPPYGVGYDGTGHPQNKNRDWSAQYEDHDAWDHFEDRQAFERFLTDVFTAASAHLAENAAWYCWHASATVTSFLQAWANASVRLHQTVIWVKPCAVLGFSMWNWRYEPCLVGWRPGHKPHAQAVPGEFTNVWAVDWEGKARCTDAQHPTQKPVRLFELPMLKHTRPGQICLETFSGSGSQIIAAECLKRRCFAVERLPQFIDVAVRRWQQFAGGQAVLEATGQTFAQVAAERGVTIE